MANKCLVICLLVPFVASLFAPLAGTLSKTEVPSEPLYYSKNAVWIMNAFWKGFPSDKKNVLVEHLDDVVNDLRGSNITYGFVFVGYWNPVDSTIGYTMSDSQITAVINALHSINCTVLAWAEDDGRIDVTLENRSKLYAEIESCMSKGFDGYNDDIENYVGTHQDWIYYLNNATVLLHGMGKLMTADVPYDWQQNTNPYLNMDYIVTMFYGVRSNFEDPLGRRYWQQNFGQYQDNNNPPASPLILGIMNYYGNAHPLAWQLNWTDNQLASGDEHPQLVGFSIWLYEYMSDRDWETWRNWISRPHPSHIPLVDSTLDLDLSQFVYPIAAVIGISAFVATALLIRRSHRKAEKSQPL